MNESTGAIAEKCLPSANTTEEEDITAFDLRKTQHFLSNYKTAI